MERSLELHEVWKTYSKLEPDILFLSAGRSSLRIQQRKEQRIIEHAGISPIQGALVTSLIRPKIVGLMGIHNHSIWKNFTEYRAEATATESKFSWALDWLAPGIKQILLRPGHTFSLGNIAPEADTAL